MEINLDNNSLIGVAALLVHASKIDDNYTEKEKNLILKFITSIKKSDDEIKEILKKAELLENNSNQLLDFTNIIKKNSLEIKTMIVKEMWKIIISDDKSDEYESNLMRRVCGLIYFPDKLSGEIKNQLKEDKV